MEFELRYASEDDLDWIIQSHDAVYREEFGFNIEFADGIAGKILALTSAKNSFTSFWIITVADERAASVAVSEIEPGVAFINFMLVLPQYRGFGLARKLLELTINHAREHGYETMRLETYSCLEDARKLYKLRGFKLAEPVREIYRFGQTIEQEFYELPLT